MAEQTIVGVDFSGREKDNATWVTTGVLRGGFLYLESCKHLSRKGQESCEKLENQLQILPNNAVAALDFPFGVPYEFAKFWLKAEGKLPESPLILTMPDLWRAAECMRPSRFHALVDEFAPTTAKEYLRIGDLPEASSCLHRTNPNMVPMTFRGMQMLHRLCSTNRATSFQVPPLNDPEQTGPILLEVMPGAALRAFCLPFKGYKSKTNRESRMRARRKREEIFDNLEEKSEVSIPNLNEYRTQCIESDDCLDSVVAAVVASLWATKSKFLCPGKERPNPKRWDKYKRKPSPGAMTMTELEAAQLEGWIYAPKK